MKLHSLSKLYIYENSSLSDNNVIGTDNLYINPDKFENHSMTNKHKWVYVSFSTLFTWPCATYILWQKQQEGNLHVYKNETNK